MRGPQFEEYFSAVTAVDAPGASELVLGLLADGTPVEQITSRLLAPAQVRVGELWERGRWSVADEHAATGVTDTALAALVSAAGRRHGGQGRHVVVACAEGEWHTLPARMAAAVAAAGEVRVTVLGPGVSAGQLGRRLSAGDVDLLALSCTLPPNLLGAARCVLAAHAAGVPVLAGGRAFGRDRRRADAIGADDWAADPAALVTAEPALAGRPTDLPAEAGLLDAVSDRTVALAHDRLLAAPRPRALTAWQRARLRDDLAWMSRYAGAAVLTQDPTILDEYLAWLVRLAGGELDAGVISLAARVLADAVEPEAPRGALLLHRAADTAAGVAARDDAR